MTPPAPSALPRKEPEKDHGSARHGEGAAFDPAPHRPTARDLRLVAVLVVVALGALIAVGLVPRMVHRHSTNREESQAAAGSPRVPVARAGRASARARVVLPASLQPIQETSIYARANGYVRKWYVDIGAEVKKDQVLVELDLPEVDEELRQARASAAQTEAAIGQSRAQLRLAQTTNDRYAVLGDGGLVSKQEVDQYSSSYEAQRSNLAAAHAAKGSAEANVRRIEELRGFGKIVAPFDGVVTMRAAEVGQLVASGTGMGQALFKVADVGVLRAFANVPQLYAAEVRAGMDASLKIREMPQRAFFGKVARTANELDLATRSLLTEIDVPNADRALVPGMYAQVSFDLTRGDPPIVVPATSVLFDAKGTRAAVVRDETVHWQAVEIESDLGDRLSIATGLSEGDEVAVTPNERLREGMRVRTEHAPRTDANPSGDGEPSPATRDERAPSKGSPE